MEHEKNRTKRKNRKSDWRPARRCCSNKCCRNSQGRSNVLLRGIGRQEPSQAWSPQHPWPRQPIRNSDCYAIQLGDSHHEMLNDRLDR